MSRQLSFLVTCMIPMIGFGQSFEPPAPKTPDAATLKRIEEKIAQFRTALAAARSSTGQSLDTIALHLKATEWIVRHREWYTADSGKQTLAVLEQGMKLLEKPGEPALVPGKCQVLAYRSKIDDSLQPYAIWLPADYQSPGSRKYRLDISLHGRDASLTEVKFIAQHANKTTPAHQDAIVIEVYGRGNNAYRWAGEDDVLQALAVAQSLPIDPNRVILKGFSMGGAGTWHIGLRRPGEFSLLQPGAGFTTTHGYIARLPNPLPDYQEKCLRIYDAIGYAENARAVPIVAYSGELDKQRQAAVNIEEALKSLGLSPRMQHVIGPKLEHKFPPEQVRIVESKIADLLPCRTSLQAPRGQFSFVTYTLKNSECAGLQIEQLTEHYRKARMEVAWDEAALRIQSENVHRFSLPSPGRRSLVLDGQTVTPRTGKRVAFELVEGAWKPVLIERPLGRKTPGLQGPIDDAFTAPFLCVVGTGNPFHTKIDQAAKAQLQRFQAEWDKFFRGQIRVKKDSEVTEQDIQSNHLILFGDPGSNTLIARVLPRLGDTLTWTAKSLTLKKQTYDAAEHLPMLIQPNPMNPRRYLVLNSGHTFHAADHQGTNALLYARLGDYAIVKPTPTDKEPAAFELLQAGLFNEEWK